MRSRLADAEHRRDEAQERARAAEELTRLAEARARASEERALVAGERVEAAAARGAGMSSAADAANDTLVRLVHACEVLERESASRGPEIQALRIALEAERSQRIQLDMQLRYPAPPEQLRSLQLRVAELERRLERGARRRTCSRPTEPAAVEVAAAAVGGDRRGRAAGPEDRRAARRPHRPPAEDLTGREPPPPRGGPGGHRRRLRGARAGGRRRCGRLGRRDPRPACREPAKDSAAPGTVRSPPAGA